MNGRGRQSPAVPRGPRPLPCRDLAGSGQAHGSPVLDRSITRGIQLVRPNQSAYATPVRWPRPGTAHPSRRAAARLGSVRRFPAGSGARGWRHHSHPLRAHCRRAGRARTIGCCSRGRWYEVGRWPPCSATSGPSRWGGRSSSFACCCTRWSRCIRPGWCIDAKPANLLLDATGPAQPHLLLSDFGTAAQPGAPRLTQLDAVIGTPGSVAPEQLAGVFDVPGAADRPGRSLPESVPSDAARSSGPQTPRMRRFIVVLRRR